MRQLWWLMVVAVNCINMSIYALGVAYCLVQTECGRSQKSQHRDREIGQRENVKLEGIDLQRTGFLED
jgi:hypothetical protein